MAKVFNSIEIIRPYIRNGNFPIDATSLFNSYEDAVEYAHHDPSAYASQIITIDDPRTKQTGVYKIDYNPNPNNGYNFVLSEIEVGNSSGSTAFNFKGSVETFDDLDNVIPHHGDMYLVKDEQAFYIASEIATDDFAWSKLGLELSFVYASETTDGIIKKELYGSFINKTGHDALWFNRPAAGLDPAQNSWIEVEHTNKESNINYAIPSIGKVKEIVSTISKQKNPYIELEALSDLVVEPTLPLQPQVKIIYHKELGGMLNHIDVYRQDGDELIQVFTTTPEDDDIYYDEQKNEYYYIYNDTYGYTSNTKKEIKLIFIVSYEGSEDGMVLDGTCTETISFNFFDKVLFGSNVEDLSVFSNGGDQVIEYNYDPHKLINTTMDSIYITIPEYMRFDSATFYGVSDFYAKDLFSSREVQIYGKPFIHYEYKLTGSTKFKSPGKILFYLSNLY